MSWIATTISFVLGVLLGAGATLLTVLSVKRELREKEEFRAVSYLDDAHADDAFSGNEG